MGWGASANGSHHFPAAVLVWRISENHCKNISFVCGDAGEYMKKLVSSGEKLTVDVVFMDPPRSGSSVEFIEAIAVLSPKRVVYISCNPDTLVRDLKYLTKKGYRVVKGVALDLFPFTEHCEAACLLSKK